MKNIIIIFITMSIFTSSAMAQTADSENTEQNLEAVLSTVEKIINNEEFVLQDIHPTSGTLHVLTCVYESPSAIWSIDYCNTDNEHLTESGHWGVSMAAEFSIKDTDTKLEYYFEQGDTRVDIYRAMEQDPSFFIEPTRWRYMKISYPKTEQKSSGRKKTIFTEQMLPFLQNLARVQEQFIAQSTQLDKQRRTTELTEQVTQALLEQSPQMNEQRTVELREQARRLVQSTQLDEQRVAELIELIRLFQLTEEKENH